MLSCMRIMCVWCMYAFCMREAVCASCVCMFILAFVCVQDVCLCTRRVFVYKTCVCVQDLCLCVCILTDDLPVYPLPRPQADPTSSPACPRCRSRTATCTHTHRDSTTVTMMMQHNATPMGWCGDVYSTRHTYIHTGRQAGTVVHDISTQHQWVMCRERM
jgi:hypothetical protein